MLADCRSFKRAANRLNISQPSMVNRIAALEESYNAQLFIRKRGDNRLTNLGVMLLPKFQQCLKSYKEAEFILLSHSKIETGEIHLAAVSPRRISSLISKLHSLYPNIKVKVSLASSTQVEEMILNGEVDAGFYVPEGRKQGLQTFEYHNYEIVAIIPKDHPLCSKERLTARDFLNQSFISREPGSLTRRVFEEFLKQHDVSVNIHYELGSREAIREAVGLGLGLSVVADDEHVPHENIVVRRVSTELLLKSSCLVIRNDKLDMPQSNALIQML